MYQFYVINTNQTLNPGLHHEVHTQKHAMELFIRSSLPLGMCSNEKEAVAKGSRYFRDADGCAICCPRAHRG